MFSLYIPLLCLVVAVVVVVVVVVVARSNEVSYCSCTFSWFLVLEGQSCMKLNYFG